MCELLSVLTETMAKKTRSNLVPPLDPDNPHANLVTDPLITGVVAEDNQTVNPDDARVTIEMNQHKYFDISIAPNQTLHLTSKELADAIQMYQEYQGGIRREVEIIGESEDSRNSHQSRGSVFDRLGDKARKKKQKESDATKQRILAERREQIRKEEEEKLEQKIALRVQLEEDK